MFPVFLNSSLNIDSDNLFKAVCLKFQKTTAAGLELVLLGHSGTLGVALKKKKNIAIKSSGGVGDWQPTKPAAINVKNAHREVEPRA